MNHLPLDPPRELLMPQDWQQGALMLVVIALLGFLLAALRQRFPLATPCTAGTRLDRRF